MSPSTSDAGPSQPKLSESIAQPLPGPSSPHVYPLPATNISPFSFYGHPNWQSQPWPLNGYPYNSYQQPYTQIHAYQPTQFQQYQLPTQVPSSARPSTDTASQKLSGKRKARTRSPSPSPPPYSALDPCFNIACSLQRICGHIGGRVGLCHGDLARCGVPSVYSGRDVE